MDAAATPITAAPPPSTTVRHGVAILLAIVAGPLGHIAAGRWRRACAWYAGQMGLGALVLVAAFVPQPRLMWAAIFGAGLSWVAVIVDVWRRKPIQPWPRGWALLVIGVGASVLSQILAVNVRANFVEAFQIPAGSMIPTLEVGDHLFVVKLPRRFSRGDVAVFRYPLDPGTTYIKRIIGVGGDVVSTRGEDVTLNGQAIQREKVGPCPGADAGFACSIWRETLDGRQWLVMADESRPLREQPEMVVPAGHYFVLGDNRDNSSDSRVWGTVPGDQMVGRASFIWWASDTQGIRWDRINQPVR